MQLPEENHGTILIVDDTPTNLQVLLETLENEGFDVLVATSGEQALERASIGLPDLILLDVLMPGMDGFDTCRALKRNETLHDIPVIFMTALDQTDNKVSGFDAGAVDYITKPLDLAEVLVRVRTHLRLRALQRALEVQNAQLWAIGEALTRFLRTDRAVEAVTALLESAVAQTDSTFGLIGVTTRTTGGTPRVRVLAASGDDDSVDREFYSTMRDRIRTDGGADYTVEALEAKIGPVLSEARTIELTRGAAASSGRRGPGSEVQVLSTPILRGVDVAGCITLSRTGDAHERAQVEAVGRFSHAASVILECDRLRQRQLEAEARRERAEEESRYLQDEVRSQHNVDEIVGESAALAEILDQARLVAATDSTVLINGETGTGKELVARAIHQMSSRADRPLICVSCVALPESLVESELFGHEKGSFTGATSMRRGRFELADGGTLFLDEVGDMPLPAQTKLLRVLQEQQLERVGGSDTIKVDVRVLAATHRDLKERVDAGEFREDLYYRLNVFPLVLPPLRERPDDIPALVHYFAQRFAVKMGLHITAVTPATMERLRHYQWPGNVRELENIVERAVILCAGAQLDIPSGLFPQTTAHPRPTPAGEAMPESRGQREPGATDRPMTMLDVEREHLLSVLERTSWLIEGPGGAATLLGLKPSTLRNRLAKLNIRKPQGAAKR